MRAEDGGPTKRRVSSCFRRFSSLSLDHLLPLHLLSLLKPAGQVPGQFDGVLLRGCLFLLLDTVTRQEEKDWLPPTLLLLESAGFMTPNTERVSAPDL